MPYDVCVHQKNRSLETCGLCERTEADALREHNKTLREDLAVRDRLADATEAALVAALERAERAEFEKMRAEHRNQPEICLGCKKRLYLSEHGYRCMDCPFFFCRDCMAYHVAEHTGADALRRDRDSLKARAEAAERDERLAVQNADRLKDENLALAEQVRVMREALERLKKWERAVAYTTTHWLDGTTSVQSCIESALSLPVTHAEARAKAMEAVCEAARGIGKWISIEELRKANPGHPCVLLADALTALAALDRGADSPEQTESGGENG